MGMQSARPVVLENLLTRKIDSDSVRTSLSVTLAVWFASVVEWANLWNAQRWMPASAEDVFTHREYWRVWTSLFVHADFRHLGSNSFLLFILGVFVVNYYGRWIFPALAILIGGINNLWVLRGMPGQVQLIGISGVVFWMGGFWLVLYLLIDRRKPIGQRTLRALGVALALFMPSEAFDPGVSYQSHLAGFITGIACGWLYYRLRRDRIRRAEVVEWISEDESIPATD